MAESANASIVKAKLMFSFVAGRQGGGSARGAVAQRLAPLREGGVGRTGRGAQAGRGREWWQE